MSTVLVVDDADIAFLYALAVRLKGFEIWLFPAESVAQAQLLLDHLGARLDLLVVNCRVRGVCQFAVAMAGRVPGLQILGVASEGHRCVRCAKLLSAVLRDRRPRQDEDIQQWTGAIRSLVPRESAELNGQTGYGPHGRAGLDN